MRILFVTPYVPSPVRIRPYAFIRELARRGHEVTLACLVQPEAERRYLADVSRYCRAIHPVGLHAAEAHRNALLSLPTRTPLSVAYCCSRGQRDLVRQLLEYKRFKDAASDLYERGEEQAMKYPPAMRACVAQEDDDGRLLQEVDLWDLISAFKRVLAETGADISTTIIRDDIPIQVYIKRLLERLTEGKYLSFFDMFKEDGDRINIIGTFLAVLELTRMGRILVEQNQLFGDIYLRLWEKEAA